jgi:type II secretory pathway pseudopilin PulG
LLVVIGIIAILMGLLFPIIAKVRMAVYKTDTANLISQISNACNSYYTTYHAYPGPFSNDDTSGALANITLNAQYLPQTSSGTPVIAGVYLSPTAISPGTPNPPWNRVTGAQNLVLGLMGGLRPGPTAGTVYFAPAEVGLGPMNLTVTNPARTPSFIPAGSNFLMWCQPNSGGQVVQTTGNFQNLSGNPSAYVGSQFTDSTGVTHAADSPIPVFVDRFPAPGPLPILYLRARTGAKGVVWDNRTVKNDPDTGGPAFYQYDLRDTQPYTLSSIGLTMGKTHYINAISNFPPAMGMNPPALANAGPYFMNASIPPTNTSSAQYMDQTGRPRAVDQFILISAGPDGIYGTTDDITSFGDVSQ